MKARSAEAVEPVILMGTTWLFAWFTAQITPTGEAPLLWLPSGLLVALAIRCRANRLGIVGATAMIAQAATGLFDPLSAIGFGVLDALAAMIGAAALCGQERRTPRLQRAKEVGGIALAALIAAVAGVVTKTLSGDVATRVAIATGTSHLLGVVAVLPIALAWRGTADETVAGLERFLFYGTCGSLAIFSTLTAMQDHGVSIAMVLAILSWSTWRLGPRETAASTLLLASFAARNFQLGIGLFARPGPQGPDSLITLHVVVSVLCLTSLAIAAGVDERRRLVDALERSEARLRVFVSGLAVGAAQVIGESVFLNAAGERLLGWSADDVKDLNSLFFALHGDAAPAMLELYRTDVTVGVNETLTVPIRRKDGVERLFEFAGQRNDDGAVWVFWDVTDRHAAMEDLRHARDAAEAASRSKEAFLATMSHEIRTPLNGVIGMLQLLRETPPLSEEQRDFADTAHGSALGLLHLLENVLDYSRLQASAVLPVNLPLDPREAIEEAIEMLAEPAARKGLTLVGIVSPDVPRRLSSDPSRLQQILLNLVGNAVKFTNDGAVSIRVDVAPDSAEREALRITVTDTGIGIAPQHWPSLFEPFSQVDDSPSRRYGGAGLGLAIVHRLVTLLAGRIELDSQPGRGTRFVVTLPLERIRDQPSASEPMGGRVLYVDSDPLTREACCTQLGALGATAEPCADLGEAMMQLRNPGEPPRAVLVACGRTDLDAPAVARAARLTFTGPVIAVTSLIDTTSRDELEASGFDARVRTPMRAAALRSVLVKTCASIARRRAG